MTEVDRQWLRSLSSLETELQSRPLTFNPFYVAKSREDVRRGFSKSAWLPEDWKAIEARKAALIRAGHCWYLTGPIAIEQLLAEGVLVERRRTRRPTQRKETLALVPGPLILVPEPPRVEDAAIAVFGGNDAA
jgi:hypothetical protein